MKYPAYHKDHKGMLEVYKVQVALFGGPAILIYNEDRSEMWEETNANNVKAMQDFIGKDVKCYCCGYYDEKADKIVLIDKINEPKYFF